LRAVDFIVLLKSEGALRWQFPFRFIRQPLKQKRDGRSRPK
jgi:hypothetical protein